MYYAAIGPRKIGNRKCEESNYFSSALFSLYFDSPIVGMKEEYGDINKIMVVPKHPCPLGRP